MYVVKLELSVIDWQIWDDGNYLPMLNVAWGAAEVIMVREIIKPVFSRTRQTRVRSQQFGKSDFQIWDNGLVMTACWMYEGKWESSIFDQPIWDKVNFKLFVHVCASAHL